MSPRTPAVTGRRTIQTPPGIQVRPRARARAGGLALTIRVCEGAQWRRQKGGGARNMRSVALYHSAHVAGSLRRRHPGQSMEISQ